jgi:hypothetical protein
MFNAEVITTAQQIENKLLQALEESGFPITASTLPECFMLGFDYFNKLLKIRHAESGGIGFKPVNFVNFFQDYCSNSPLETLDQISAIEKATDADNLIYDDDFSQAYVMWRAFNYLVEKQLSREKQVSMFRAPESAQETFHRYFNDASHSAPEYNPEKMELSDLL